MAQNDAFGTASIEHMNLNIIKSKIRSIPDWPQKGVVFRDITPILEDKELFSFLINELAETCEKEQIDKIVGIDARGFILASALAYKMRTGLALARKKGKLPYETVSREYSYDYASAILEMHKDAIKQGEKILIVDDVLATGGTMGATVDIAQKLGSEIIGILFLIEIESLNGLKKLKGQNVTSLIKF